jgi:hypothetical protein
MSRDGIPVGAIADMAAAERYARLVRLARPKPHAIFELGWIVPWQWHDRLDDAVSTCAGVPSAE